ncbi:fructose-specific PTS transporter subunit EIIC [Streptomyces sp. TR02-1]|uniref:PTS fructose transporter subunit IIABC n=1 Tax=Streptomyces sp. TR02-1 TaxID=3385977 RepID=UPI0039A15761
MTEMITAELVDLDLTAPTGEAATRALAARMAAVGRISDLDGFLADVAAREEQMPTGMEGGIGVPHCRSAHVTEPTLAFGRSSTGGVDFGAADGPADLIFLIAAPAGADSDHLAILSGLARKLMDEEITGALRSRQDPEAVAALLRGEDPAEKGPGPEASAADAPSAREESAGDAAGDGASAADGARPFRIVAVTSCPTGIAHTYMAAEALERAGRTAGVEITVETQGSGGFTRLDPAVIAAADGVILAHDVEVREKERFLGKPTVDVGVKTAVSRASELVDRVREAAARGETGPPAPADAPAAADEGASADHFGVRLRKWLMTGVSYMVPFVAAGGLLIALAFALGGYDITEAPSVAEQFSWTDSAAWAALLFQVGSAAFDFLVPVLAGYVAYGMVDRPGLAPGIVGGSLAVTIEAGFLGGLVAGLLAGAVVAAIQRIDVPPVLRGIMPVVVIPLLSSVLVGFLMFVVVGKPLAALQSALTDWLSGLSGANAVMLGVLLGLMMCFDLGGPVNKVAYAFAVGGLTDPTGASLRIMAAVMAAGMVPPLGMALATTLRGRLFDRTERENGKAAWVLGASFISEGAIPFAAADPLRVIPSTMAGGAVTGALSMAFGATLRAPHGGVFVVPLIGSPLLYLTAIAAGTAVTAGLVVVLKSLRAHRSSTDRGTDPGSGPAGSPAPSGGAADAEPAVTT